jgi:hypothetical protein
MRSVARLASSERESEAKAIGQVTKMIDGRWAATAIAETRCYATNYLDRLYAEVIIGGS